MRTLQRRQVIGLTVAGALMVVLSVATFANGEYRMMPAWRIGLDVVMGVAGIAILWEIWKPGGSGRA